MENNGIIMPELVIHRAIKSMLDLVKQDWINESNKEKTLIYMFFKKDENNNDIVFNTMDYYNQAVELFTKNIVQVNMGYNLEVAEIPSLHILLPSENSRFMGIGADENYVDPDITIENIAGQDVEFTRPYFTKTFDTTYNIMITSPNIFQVLLLYNLMKMGFLSLYENIEFHGLRNIKIGGQDINVQSDLVPTHLFHRNLTLSFFYEMNSPRFFKEQLIKSFTVITP